MRPVVVFGIVFSTLICGTLASRFADAGALPAARTGAALSESALVTVHLPGTFELGTGEIVALHEISRHLDADAATPVSVDWIESYRARSVMLRAAYDPIRQSMTCTRGKRGHYQYDPITPAGIHAALRDNCAAPFAEANLLSMTHVRW
jgi:hypothetical protein